MDPAVRDVKRRTLRKKLGLAYGPYKVARQAVGHVRKSGTVRRILSRKGQPVKLHIASGENYKEGWVNIDLHPITKKDVLHDLSKGIPFPDNSVDFIYNEHFIEHLSYKDGFAFMNEAYRVLKPGGVMRIACPDLAFWIDGYVKDNWRSQEWVGLINAHWYPNRCFMLNQHMREDGGHKYIYDYEGLSVRLNEAGFFSHHIQAVEMNRSAYPELRDIDWRGDSLIVEAKRDRSFAASGPLLTVVVPAYNNEATIAKTLDSILEQKTDFKFIIKVAEDGSTDGTQKILMDYRDKHPGVVQLFMQGKSRGMEKALHRVLKTVDTEYLAFLEAGDYWSDPAKLQTQVEALKANPDCVIAAHNTLVEGARGGAKSNFVTKGGSKDKYGAEDRFEVHPSSIVCRNVVPFPSVPVYRTYAAKLPELYRAEGKLLFTDKMMSVHNVTDNAPVRKPRVKEALFSLMRKRR